MGKNLISIGQLLYMWDSSTKILKKAGVLTCSAQNSMKCQHCYPRRTTIQTFHPLHTIPLAWRILQARQIQILSWKSWDSPPSNNTWSGNSRERIQKCSLKLIKCLWILNLDYLLSSLAGFPCAMGSMGSTHTKWGAKKNFIRNVSWMCRECATFGPAQGGECPANIFMVNFPGFSIRSWFYRPEIQDLRRSKLETFTLATARFSCAIIRSGLRSDARGQK